MKDLGVFLKRTWWLFLVLFIAPIFVIAIFAILEFQFHRIDLTSGEWASLFGGAFGYWGTVILGTIAFWQNERAQKNNDILTQFEKRKMSPVFIVKFLGSEGQFSKIKFNILNCTEKIACELIISNLNVYCIKNGNTESIGEYNILNQDKEYVLGARESLNVCYNTIPISIQNAEKLLCKMNINSTDIVGLKKKTAVEIEISKELKCLYRYNIEYSEH